MKKPILSLVVFALVGIAVQAQSSKVVTAINALYSGELLKAKEAIDAASIHEKTIGEAKTWLYRGRIHNMIALDTSGKFAVIPNPIDIALESFKTGLNCADVKNYKKDIGDELFTTYNLYFSKGAIAYNAGDLESAYQNFTKANEANMLQLDANPTAILDTGVIFNIGLTAERTNRTIEAITAFQRLVDMKYRESYLYSELSDLYLENGQLEEALKVIEAGRANFPQDKDIMITELNFYLNQNKLTELVGKLQTAISMDPENPELYFVLGTTHGELIKLDSMHAEMHFDEAVAAYEKALSYAPDRFDINLNMGALFYNTAIEINKTMNALPLEKQAEYEALTVERNNLYNQALPYFEKAHEVNPEDVPTMQALKEIYVRLNLTDKAEAMKQKLEGR
jgi:tetratricopeptide (TPR) repeat protein